MIPEKEDAIFWDLASLLIICGSRAQGFPEGRAAPALPLWTGAQGLRGHSGRGARVQAREINELSVCAILFPLYLQRFAWTVNQSAFMVMMLHTLEIIALNGLDSFWV